MGRGGVEPPTPGFSVLCSTNWATCPKGLFIRNNWLSINCFKWAGAGLSRRTPGFSVLCSTNWARQELENAVHLNRVFKWSVSGLNRRTPGFSVLCSTNWVGQETEKRDFLKLRFLVVRVGIEPQDARIFSPVLYQLSYLPKGLGFERN